MIQSRQGGYSLVELIIAMTIFAMLIVGVVGTLVSVTRTSQKSAVNRVVQQEVRYSIEGIAREIRQSTINYRFYEANTSSACSLPNRRTLALKTSVGGQSTPMFIYYYFDNTPGAESIKRYVGAELGNCALITAAPAMTSPEVRWQSLTFIVAPTADPLSVTNTDPLTRGTHPRVTIVGTGALATARPGVTDSGTVTVETTISSRNYPIETVSGSVNPSRRTSPVAIIYGDQAVGVSGPGSPGVRDSANRSLWTHTGIAVTYQTNLPPGTYYAVLSYKNHLGANNLLAPLPPYTFGVGVSYGGTASGAAQSLSLSPAATLSGTLPFNVTAAGPGTIIVSWNNDYYKDGESDANFEINQLRIYQQ